MFPDISFCQITSEMASNKKNEWLECFKKKYQRAERQSLTVALLVRCSEIPENSKKFPEKCPCRS